MTVSDYLYKKLSTIATTYPLNVPIEVKPPYIVYEVSGQEVTKTVSGVGYSEVFTTISVYATEYDKAEDLAELIKAELNDCKSEQNIIGATFTSKATSYDGEPVDLYSTLLEYSIFER